MKPIDVKTVTYNYFAENNDKDPKCRVGDHVRILKCKKHFCKSSHSKLA